MSQRGWLLAEWLLASLLGLLVLAALAALLQDSLLLARSQRQQRPVQQAAAWLLQRLGDGLVLAGRGGVHPLGLDDARLAAWWPDSGHGAGRPAADQLLLQRVSETAGSDCEGNGIVAGQRVLERYFLRADSAAPGWVLACDAGFCDAAGCQRLGDAGAALQADIDSFQVRYLTTAAAGQAAAWIDAAALRQLAGPPGVRGVRVAILLHGSESQAATRRWEVPPDWFGPSPGVFSDRLVHGAWLMTRELPHGVP